jgi:carbamoyl-phosphate synthase large subunit
MMPSLNVLITAASRRVQLVNAFRKAIVQAGLRGRVIVTDVNPLSPAVRAADAWHLVPMADDPAYLPQILDICEAAHVGLVVPTIDDELVLFGEAKETFAARQIRVAVSPPATSAICNDKYETSRVLRQRGVAAAAAWLPGEVPSRPSLPLFIKPRFGRGGVGAYAVRNERELAFFTDYVAEPVLQEFLAGPEFTIDMCCDFDGRVLAIVPRERVVIRSGVSDRGRTVRDARLLALGAAVAEALPFVGAVNVQCRVVDGTPTVFEINPRFSGGIPLTIAAGADFPRMLVDLAAGRRVAPSIGHFRDNLWMTNFESSVFVDAADLVRDRRAPSPSLGDAA